MSMGDLLSHGLDLSAEMRKTDVSLPLQSSQLYKCSIFFCLLIYQFLAINSNEEHSPLFLNFLSDRSQKHFEVDFIYREIFTWQKVKTS